MDWKKLVPEIIGKLRYFFALLAGYFYGKKVQKLKDSEAQSKAEISRLNTQAGYEKHKSIAIDEARQRFAKMREDYHLSLVNPASQPSVQPDKESPEPVIDLGNGSELRTDRS